MMKSSFNTNQMITPAAEHCLLAVLDCHVCYYQDTNYPTVLQTTDANEIFIAGFLGPSNIEWLVFAVIYCED